jgi:hypothetical protein
MRIRSELILVVPPPLITSLPLVSLARARLLEKETPGPDWTGITIIPEK